MGGHFHIRFGERLGIAAGLDCARGLLPPPFQMEPDFLARLENVHLQRYWLSSKAFKGLRSKIIMSSRWRNKIDTLPNNYLTLKLATSVLKHEKLNIFFFIYLILWRDVHEVKVFKKKMENLRIEKFDLTRMHLGSKLNQKKKKKVHNVKT